MNLELFKPYLGKSFELEKEDGYSCFCVNADVFTDFRGRQDVYLWQDFFSVVGVVKEDWNVSGRDPLVCESPYGEVYKLHPVYPPDLEVPPKVEWKDELGLKNLLNENLWEKDLIREIFGITYYPLNLFQFTDRRAVKKNPDMQFLFGVLEINRHYFPKTLYYYIEGDFMYIGIWNYTRRMPLKPVRYLKIKNVLI